MGFFLKTKVQCLYVNTSTSRVGCILQEAQGHSGRPEYFSAGINLIYVSKSYSTAFCSQRYNLSKNANNFQI